MIDYTKPIRFRNNVYWSPRFIGWNWNSTKVFLEVTGRGCAPYVIERNPDGTSTDLSQDLLYFVENIPQKPREFYIRQIAGMDRHNYDYQGPAYKSPVSGIPAGEFIKVREVLD